MQDTYFCIEQLDFSAQQLHTVTPAFARFSLILTDNIVELMLYEFCKREMSRDLGWFSYGKHFGGEHRFDAKTRAEVLGQDFDNRPKFCHKQGVLTVEQLEFILTGHEYRNQVYHVGLRHESILYAIAWQYHDLACDIFAGLYPLYAVWSSNDKISASVAKHTGTDGIQSDTTKEDMAKACSSLKAAKPPLAAPFEATLKEEAMNRVSRFDAALDVIAKDDSTQKDTELVELQFYNFVYGEKSPHLESVSACKSKADLNKILEPIRSSWKPDFPRSPVASWERRANGIGAERNPLLAMKKFQCLVDQMDTISEVVFERAEEIENYIRLQIDEARGK